MFLRDFIQLLICIIYDYNLYYFTGGIETNGGEIIDNPIQSPEDGEGDDHDHHGHHHGHHDDHDHDEEL